MRPLHQGCALRWMNGWAFSPDDFPYFCAEQNRPAGSTELFGVPYRGLAAPASPRCNLPNSASPSFSYNSANLACSGARWKGAQRGLQLRDRLPVSSQSGQDRADRIADLRVVGEPPRGFRQLQRTRQIGLRPIRKSPGQVVQHQRNLRVALVGQLQVQPRCSRFPFLHARVPRIACTPAGAVPWAKAFCSAALASPARSHSRVLRSASCVSTCGLPGPWVRARINRSSRLARLPSSVSGTAWYQVK